MYLNLPDNSNRDKKGRFRPSNNVVSYPKSRFKEGNSPWNKLDDGIERIRKVGGRMIWFVKVDGLWREKHRLIWEQEKGPIPKSMVLVFKNFNSRDCSLDNLMLVTRSENIKRSKERLQEGKRKRKLLRKYGL